MSQSNDKVHTKGGKIQMNTKEKSKGFTIIEVVLVLAIAGLIFLMVFIALPALQRSQRDTQRKNDMSRLITALTNYQSNNKSTLPTNWTKFISDYLTVSNDTFADPSTGATYIITPVAAIDTPATLAEGTIYATTGAICNGEDLVTGQVARKAAFRLKLEGGGVSCVNN